jgi:hypothetical protein
MILQVKVKAGSKLEKIEKDAAGNWVIKIKAPAVEGKANEALIQLLSKKLHVSKSSIQILSGHTSKLKRINVDGIEVQEAEQKLTS